MKGFLPTAIMGMELAVADQKIGPVAGRVLGRARTHLK